MPDLPLQTISEFGRLGAIGLEIDRCPRCGACTQVLWEALGAVADDRLGDVVARMRCRGCDGRWPEVPVHGYFGSFDEA